MGALRRVANDAAARRDPRGAAGLIEQARAVEEAVRGFLARDEGDALAIPLGPAGAWLSLQEEATDATLWPSVLRGIDIGRLEVLEIDEDRAVVDLSAQRHYEHRDPRGRRSDVQTVAYEGPVRLELTGGAWRVVDFVVGGRSVLDAVKLDVHGSQEHDGVTVRATAVLLARRVTSVILAVENRRAHPLGVTVASLRSGRRWRGAIPMREHVPAGATTLIGVQANGGFALDVERLEVAVLLAGDEPRGRLPFVFSVDLGAPSSASPTPPPSRLPLLASLEGRWPNGALFLALAAAVTTVLAITSQWRWLGLISLAYGAMATVHYARRRHYLGASWWLGAGAVLIALGAIVLALSG